MSTPGALPHRSPAQARDYRPAYDTSSKRHSRCNLFVDVAWYDGSHSAAVSFLYNWLAEGCTTIENEHWASRCRRLQEDKPARRKK